MICMICLTHIWLNLRVNEYLFMNKDQKYHTWAVTGTFHGSIITASSEGEARSIFHRHYNGETIVHIKKVKRSPWVY